jgi:hypothetical protein
VTVTRRILDKEVTRITGSELAQLIDATRPRNGYPPLVDRGTICEELDCLSELVQVLGGAKPGEFPLDKSLYWVGESLKRLSNRIMALEQSGNAAPNWYAVEVKK